MLQKKLRITTGYQIGYQNSYLNSMQIQPLYGQVVR